MALMRGVRAIGCDRALLRKASRFETRNRSARGNNSRERGLFEGQESLSSANQTFALYRFRRSLCTRTSQFL